MAEGRGRLARAAGCGAVLQTLHRELVELSERRLRAVAAAAAELSEFARGDRAPRELRALQQRVDRGELTWERVALGEVGGLVGLLGDHTSGPDVAPAGREARR